MIKSISKHNINKILIVTALLITICMIFSGCSIVNCALNKASELESNNKIQCTINENNGTKIVYDDVTYQILEEKFDKSELGGWRGVFRTIVLLDENYKSIKQLKMKADPYTQLKNIVKNPPDSATYAVPFYNVFSIKGVDDSEAIAIHLFNGFYKAVCTDLKSEQDKTITFDSEHLSELSDDLN